MGLNVFRHKDSKILAVKDPKSGLKTLRFEHEKLIMIDDIMRQGIWTKFADGVHVDKRGHKFYVEKRVLHRLDGPAIERKNGTMSWWVKGKRHREDGPAIEYFDGDRSYLLNNQEFKFEDWIDELAKTNPEHATMMKLKYA